MNLKENIGLKDIEYYRIFYKLLVKNNWRPVLYKNQVALKSLNTIEFRWGYGGRRFDSLIDFLEENAEVLNEINS